MKKPSNTFSFKIDEIGEFTENKYSGTFVYKRPTIGQKREILREETILNSEYEDSPNSEIFAINAAIAFLKVTLIEYPKWFKDLNFGLDMEDENILDCIANKIDDFENKRLKKLDKIVEKNIQEEKSDE